MILHFQKVSSHLVFEIPVDREGNFEFPASKLLCRSGTQRKITSGVEFCRVSTLTAICHKYDRHGYKNRKLDIQFLNVVFKFHFIISKSFLLVIDAQNLEFELCYETWHE